MGILDKVFDDDYRKKEDKDKDKDNKKPDFSDVRTGGLSKKADFSDVHGDSSSTAPAKSPFGTSKGSYTVKAGDSLSKIAKREYGDGAKWKQIYEANRHIIKDPDLIYPGQELTIPSDG
ncbi:MAG: LysM peptidoglycan-binding domain-containing protein [Anaerolineae bacterium]|nr:LysM peptidoglycan-binding domain-containing protein [Gemmatimonadaceae bacterium]